MAITKEIIITSNMDETAKDADRLAGSLDKVDKEGKKAAKSIDDVAGNGGAIAILDNLTGGLATRMKDAFEATKLFNVSLKGTKTALLATGIGAFVVALGLVVAYWDDIVEFVTRTNERLEYQSTILENQRVQIDHKLKINEQLLELAEIEGRSRDKLLGLERDLLVEKRKNLEDSIKILEAQLAIEESKIREVTLFEKGLIGLKAYILGYGTVASSVTNALGLDVIAEAQGKLDKLKEELGAIDISIARIDNPKTDKAKTEAKATDTSKITFDDSAQKRIDEEIKAIEEISRIRQEFADKNREDELVKSEVERERKLLELETLVADEVFKREAIAEVNKYYDEQALQIAQERADKEAEIEKEKNDKIKDDEERLRDAKFQIANQTLNVLGSLAKEGSDLAKGIAASQATINTFQGVTSALSATSVIPDPFGTILKFANAAAIGIAGFINVKKILSTKPVTKSASGGGSGTSAPPAPSFNLVQGTGSNQIADSIQGGTQPIKAYVVSSDVSSSQEMDRNIESNATL